MNTALDNGLINRTLGLTNPSIGLASTTLRLADAGMPPGA